MRRRPIILGIVGDSAAGKTTLTKGIARILGPERVTHVCTDDYHRYDRRERAELGITALHPECNYIDILEQHIERLHYGLPILKPKYDHATGTLVRPEYVVPREFVIVDRWEFVLVGVGRSVAVRRRPCSRTGTSSGRAGDDSGGPLARHSGTCRDGY